MARDLQSGATSERREPSARLQRPGFKDPKLILGVLLILVSIVGVIAIVQLNNRTTQYYTAKNDIHIGDKISTDMLNPVDANMGSASKNYFSADEIKDGDLIATRFINAGDIVSKSSASTETKEKRRLVTVSIDRGAATTLKAGGSVDVWAASRQSSNNGQSPSSSNAAKEEGGKDGSSADNTSNAGNGSKGEESSALVTNAEISNIIVQESVLGANGKATVQLWVNDDDVRKIVQANANDMTITLVPGALGEGK